MHIWIHSWGKVGVCLRIYVYAVIDMFNSISLLLCAIMFFCLEIFRKQAFCSRPLEDNIQWALESKSAVCLFKTKPRALPGKTASFTDW